MNRFFYFLGGVCLFFASCTFSKIVVHNAPSIKDTKIFEARELKNTPSEFPFFISKENIQLPPPSVWTSDQEKPATENDIYSFLERTNSLSLLVVRNDSLLFEWYNEKLEKHPPQKIFSITKVFVTTLVAIALEEGKLKSLDQKVSEFIPSFSKGLKSKITLRHCIQMTSGINHNDYTRILPSATLYYNTNLDKQLDKLKMSHEPGTHFAYKSVDTQILGHCLEKAIGKSVSDYLEEKIWQPLGMEQPGLFTLDSENGNERMFGGMAVGSRDLLRLGKLFKNKGKWKGKQIVPVKWIKEFRTRTPKADKWWGYTYGWWLDGPQAGEFKNETDFIAAGYMGQILYVDPDNDIMIVRRGWDNADMMWHVVIERLAELIAINVPNRNFSLDSPSLDFKGIYEGEDIRIEIRKKDKDWLIEDSKTGNSILYKRYAPLSIFSKKGFNKIMFKIEGNEILGIYFDEPSDMRLRFLKRMN